MNGGHPSVPAASHRALQASLAAHMRSAGFRTFTEIEIHGLGGGPGRLDLVALKPSYAHKDVRGYEVKATRADFMRGLESGRWADYRASFHRIYFATPAGLVGIDEVPAECGLMVFGKGGWMAVRAARPHQPPRLSVDVLLSLLLRGLEEERRTRDLRERFLWVDNVKVEAKAFGHDVARRLQSPLERPPLEEPLRRLKETLERELGLALDNDWQVAEVERSLVDMLHLYRDTREHRETLRQVARYLDGLGGRLLPSAEERLHAALRSTLAQAEEAISA